MMGSSPPPQVPKTAALELLVELISLMRDGPESLDARIAELKALEASTQVTLTNLRAAQDSHDRAAHRLETTIEAVSSRESALAEKEGDIIRREAKIKSDSDLLAQQRTNIVEAERAIVHARADLEKETIAQRSTVTAELQKLRQDTERELSNKRAETEAAIRVVKSENDKAMIAQGELLNARAVALDAKEKEINNKAAALRAALGA